jgi:uncharacterized membrane protein
MGIEFHLKVPGWGGSIWDRVLFTIMVVAILGTLGAFVNLVSVPIEERFTEFYALDLNRRTSDYPSQLMAGEEGEVVVGIINREDETTTYRVEVRIGGVLSGKVELMTLEHGEKWEESLGFTSDRTGDKQKVELLLYNYNKQAEGEVYQRLYLLVDVQ